MLRRVLWHLTPPALHIVSRTLSEMQDGLRARKQMARYAKLHLACGSNILPGWANVDLFRSDQVIRWDLSRPLPVASDSIRFIYSEHFIEHMSPPHAIQLLYECYRALQAGGVLRISTPDLRNLVDKYLSGQISEWRDLGWQPRTPCHLLNEGMRWWGHQFLYDEAELKSIFEECGFAQIARVRWRESAHAELQGLECRPFHDEIILEGVKQRA